MIVTDEAIEFTKDLITQYCVKKLVEYDAINQEEALKKFLLSKTYGLLDNNESRLWAESPEYVLNMLEDECNGNLNNWLII